MEARLSDDYHPPYGAVKVAQGSMIAATAILGAEPDGSLTIAPEVCLGSEVVIQARWGSLTIETGAIIGRGVLIIGRGSIGAGACIGSNSTLINPQIAACRVVPPETLLGDPSGDPSISSHEMAAFIAKESTEASSKSVEITSVGITLEVTSAQSGQLISDDPNGNSGLVSQASLQNNGHSYGGKLGHIYGKAQVNQLLKTLFPHRRPLETSSELSSNVDSMSESESSP